MELREAIRTNAAYRDFTPEPVPDDVLYAVLDTARFAPSGGNRQAWTVIVVRDPETRRALRDLSVRGMRIYAAYREAGIRPFSMGPDGRWPGHRVDVEAAATRELPPSWIDRLDEVPVLLVVTYDLTEIAFLDIEAPYQPIVGGTSVYPFVQNILLAARDLGLGGVPATFPTPSAQEVRDLLGIPDAHAVACVIALGHPVKVVSRLNRRPVEEFARIDRFDGPPLTP